MTTTADDQGGSTGGMRPLLEGIESVGAPDRRGPSLRERFARSAAALLHADVRLSRRSGMLLGAAIASAGALTGGAFAWAAFRPIHAPDAQRAPLPDILGFALLDADFSRLPVQERMKLVLGLAARLRSMGAGDSAIVAAFAAGIAGKAREQLEANVRTLGMDMMADYAQQYAAAPEAEKEKTLEKSLLEMTKLMEQLTGQERDISNEERLKEMREQAQRDAERGRETDRPLTPERVSGLFRMVQEDIAKHSAPNNRAATQRFIRDMTRTLRGRDPATNQPKKG